MCIIVYKPIGKPFPDEHTLECCFLNNDDGAGYMYAFNGKVHIHKGFMDFKSFTEDLGRSRAVTGDSVPYVMHFRISTQGGRARELTHPYPLTENLKKMKKLHTVCNIGIAHNGVIDLTSTSQKDIGYNDTMEFIRRFLTLIIRDKTYYKDSRTVELIRRLTESKLAILDSTGHCELIGTFFEEDGIWYSNTSYMYGGYLKSFRYDSPYYSEYGYCPILDGIDDYSLCLECPQKELCFEDEEELRDLLKYYGCV